MQLKLLLGSLLLGSLTGCYAAVGPTVGIDLPTGRATLGVEGSAETFTVAHSIALGSKPLAPSPARSVPDAESKYWTTHTYLLWEPGLGGSLSDTTDGKFTLLGGGASVGVRINRYADAPPDADIVGGAWGSTVHALSVRTDTRCGADDTRPYVALVVGIRGYELYASPKVGVVHVPGFCLFGDGDQL